MYDYVFSENGLVAYKNGELLAIQVGHHTVLYTCIGLKCIIFRILRKQWEKKKSKLSLTSACTTWLT